MRINFIGIGGQKCASSWIFNILEGHPAIVTSSPKELDFFSRYFDRGYQWYERHFQEGGIAGEMSPSYIYDPLAPERARAYNRHLRIIVALRDPVERAYSNHLHEVREGHFQGADLSFSAGLANNPMYEFQSYYATHLKKWFAVFPRESIHCVLQEEIAADPARAARALYEFLGVTPAFDSPYIGRRANESVAAKVAWIDNSMRAGANAMRRLGFGHAINAMKDAPVFSAVWHANKIDYRDIVPKLDEEMRLALAARFKDDLIELANLLGRKQFPWPTWQHLFGEQA